MLTAPVDLSLARHIRLAPIAAVAALGCSPNAAEPPDLRLPPARAFNAVRPDGLTADAEVDLVASPPVDAGPGPAWRVTVRLTNTGGGPSALRLLGGNCMFRVAAYAGPPATGGRLLWPGVRSDDVCQTPLYEIAVGAGESRSVTGYAPARAAIDRAAGLRAVYPRVLVQGIGDVALLYIDGPAAAVSTGR